MLVALVAVLAGCESQKETPATSSANPPGAPGAAAPAKTEEPKAEPAPQTDAASVEVKPVTAEELKRLVAENKGKAVLVDFWATWCVPCRKGYPHTVELADKHPDDLVVYSVSMDGDGPADPDTLADVKSFLAEHPGKVRTLISATGGEEKAYGDFDITGGALPHYKVYGRDGQLVTTFGGDVDEPIDPAKIDEAVAKAIGK
jgi:thiol-disulfide isomerase/thioredoxin